METIVSHVLSVGITTLLIVGLVSGATGFLETHEARAAQTEIETIGNRLAGSMASADRLAQQSDGVTVHVTLSESVAGSSYTTKLVHGTCSGVPTSTCLELSAGSHEVSTVVAVRNETSLHLERGVGGQFVISSNGSSGFDDPERRRLDMSARIGIGHDVGGPGTGTGRSFSQPPVAAFQFEPDPPDVADTIQFDGSASFDPDGTIDTWKWDWDNDGNFEENHTNPTADHGFGFGDHNITLRVTDGTGMTGNTTQEIDVSGLEYLDDMGAVTGSPANPHALTFNVTNHYGQPITIERFLIDPHDDSNDELDNGFDNEIEIDTDGDGSPEGYVDWWNARNIPDDGTIVYIEGPGHTGSEATLPAGDTAQITMKDFDDALNNEKFTVGVRYWIGSETDAGSNVFNDTVDPPNP